MGKSEDKEIGVKADSLKGKNKIIWYLDTEITDSYALIYTFSSTTSINSMMHPAVKTM